MKTLSILVDEHKTIRQALESLTVAIEKLENGEKVSPDFFRSWFDFYRSFVLNFHHFKEEHVMFRHLAGRKGGVLDNQIEALRHQHERGRDLISEAEKALPGYEKELLIQSDILLESLASYASLLRHHIHREENLFYPLVEKTFTETEDNAVLDEFEKEARKAGETAYNDAQNNVRAMGMLLET